VGALAEGLPPALYTTDGTEQWLRTILTMPGRSNEFSNTRHKLLITATDLDSAQRLAFGADEGPTATISEAAAASTSIPLLYTPRHILNRTYVDGALRSTTSIDVAIGHGAKLVICVNPLVPSIHDVRHLVPSATGLASRHIFE
jgi:NTE family protein